MKSIYCVIFSSMSIPGIGTHAEVFSVMLKVKFPVKCHGNGKQLQ